MKRRALLQSLAGLLVARPALGSAAAALQSDALTATQVATLTAMAEVVLPSAIGAAGRDSAVEDFVRWLRNYREGADTGHGYGAATLSRPTGPSPAARYPEQFAALDRAARAAGAASFAALAQAGRRAIVAAALEGPPRVTRLPARPTGANLVADFMGLWFNSAAAFDLAYNAQIGRDTCRSLDGSDKAPR
jgi:hypothetical protein